MVWLLRARLRSGQIVIAFLAFAAALLLGSKILYLIEAWPQWWTSGSEFRAALLSPYLRLPGGFVLAVAIGPPIARWLHVRYLWFADTAIPAAGLAIFGARIGCFLDGCCFGAPSMLPWAMRFPRSSAVYRWQAQESLIPPGAMAPLAVHPLQIYFALVGLLLFGGLAVYQRRKRYDGELLLLFVVLYCWSTWALELLRAEPHDFTRHLVLGGSIAGTALLAFIEARLLAGPTSQPHREISARPLNQPSPGELRNSLSL
jgi:prolipoprotein diacylglyceryltransferase